MLGFERFFLPILSDQYSCANFSGSPDDVDTSNMNALVGLMTAGRWRELSDSLGKVVVERTQLKTSKSPASHREGTRQIRARTDEG